MRHLTKEQLASFVPDTGLQGITTKYLPCTDRRGSRIKAITESGISKMMPFNHALNIDENHAVVAWHLAKDLGWLDKHRLTFGSLHRGGYAFILVPSQKVIRSRKGTA
jgi:hypothetical protein